MKTVLRTVLAASAIALFFAGSDVLAADAEPETGDAPQTMNDDAAPTPALDAEAEQPQNDETNQANGLMKNFTRHRPGACPEGPPCSVED